MKSSPYKLNRASIPINSNETKNFIQKNLSVFHTGSQHIAQTDVEESFRKFLTKNTNNKINQDDFKYAEYCHGTSQAITEFIARNNNRRLRVSNIDFVLSKIVGNAYHLRTTALEEDRIRKNDCIVMSFPFSGNGSYYNGYQDILSEADKLGVPVLIDGAYFGIGNGIEYPLNYDCVTDFTTSLSKCHGVADYRIGIRFRKEFVDDHISASKDAGVFNRFTACIGVCLMSNFNHDHILKKYVSQQKKICDDLKIGITKTLTFGLGENEKWSKYSRGDNARICISENFI